MHIRNKARIITAVAALTIVATACGDDDEADSTDSAARSRSRTHGQHGQHRPPRSAGPTGGARGRQQRDDVDLTGICPDPLVIQTDWFPEPDHGYTYQAIGTGGTVDVEAGDVPRAARQHGHHAGDPCRSGPYIMGSRSRLEQNLRRNCVGNSLAGYADTGDVIRNAGAEQLIEPVRELRHRPSLGVWDPELSYPARCNWNVEDQESGALVSASRAAATWTTCWKNRGKLDPKPDRRLLLGGPGGLSPRRTSSNRDSPPTRCTSTTDIPEWKQASQLPPHPRHGLGHLPVRPFGEARGGDESKECLEKLVPIFQQALVDYVKDPEPMNEKFVEISPRWTRLDLTRGR